MVVVAQVSEAGVELCHETAGEGAEAAGGRPEWEVGMRFGEELGYCEGIMDRVGTERGNSECGDQASGLGVDLGDVSASVSIEVTTRDWRMFLI